MNAQSAIGLSGRVKLRVRQAGRIIRETPWRKNLILDAGLNLIATTRFADCFLFCCAGTSNLPVEDTPSATATWSGTTVTASASTFTTNDVGKLIVFATGQQAYVTGFTDATHVTVSVSNTIPAATAFVLWRVNQTTLGAEVMRTNNYSQNVGDNATTAAGPSVTLQRTYLFPEETGAGHTYYELGLSNVSVAGANLFSRIVLSPGVTVSGPTASTPGQQLEVIYQLILVFGPSAPNVLSSPQNITGLPRSYWISQIQPSVGGFTLTINSYVPFFSGDQISISGTSSAYDGNYLIAAITPGTAQTLIQVNGTSHGSITGPAPGVGTLTGYINLVEIAQNYAVATVAPSGVTTFPPAQVLSGEPSQIGSIWAADAPMAAATATGSSSPATQAPYQTIAYTLGAYTGGSFQITKAGTFPATINFNFVAIGLGIPDTFQNQVLRVDCGQRQAKQTGETLSLTFTQSWVRNFF